MPITERLVSRHFASGDLPKVPVLVHGGSKMTRSAETFKGMEDGTSATIGSAFSVPILFVTFFHMCILRFE